MGVVHKPHALYHAFVTLGTFGEIQEHFGNIGNIAGTLWEHYGNMSEHY